MTFLRRLMKGLLLLVALGVLAVATLVAYLSYERSTDVELPRPTGSFAVGRTIYDWRDEKHEVLAWIWYPARSGASTAVDEYIPAWMRSALGPDPFPFRFVYRDKSKVHAHSVRDAQVLTQQPYPVVLLRGGASAGVAAYTTLAEDLASHGYVVAGLDAPYRTGRVAFPDGRVLARSAENDIEEYEGDEAVRVATRLLGAWTSDMAFALDRLAQLNASDPSGKFTGRLDLSRVGAFGHSFGGAQAAQFCHDDERCKAAIDIDGLLFGSVIQEGMPKPFMFLMESSAKQIATSADVEVRRLLGDMRSLYAHLPSDTRLSLSIRGANHFSFNDEVGVMTSRVVLGLLRLVGALRIDGRRQLAVTTYCVHTFFDAHLKQRATRPNLLSPQYPELEALDLQ
jgi:predicted dienelactone hydrolase